MTEVFATPDENARQGTNLDIQTSWGDVLGASAQHGFLPMVNQVARLGAYGAAEGEMYPGLNTSDMPTMRDVELFDQQRAAPDMSIDDAKARVKQEGLQGKFKLPDQPTMKPAVLDLMIQEAHERDAYNAAVSRGPTGSGALGWVTEMGLGIVDPINAAAFAIPVLGEALPARMMAGAGESMLSRAAIRAGVGAAQGAAGTALLQPADWWLHTRDGQDYTMADALKSIVMGAGMGGVFHAGGGAVGDLVARAKGLPLPGSVEDLQTRAVLGDTHAAALLERMGKRPTPQLEPGGNGMTPESAPAIEAGSPPVSAPPGGEEVPGISAAEPVEPAPAPEAIPAASEDHAPLPQLEDLPADHPARVLDDLPERAREDVTRSAIADVISGNAVRGAELLEEAAKAEPRIAESLEAWHGSPHDFDRFDIAHLGSGEGAQSYGHGLYFAEHEAVARSYQAMRARDGSGGSTVGGKPFDVFDPLHEASSLVHEFGTREKAIAEQRARMAEDPDAPGDFNEVVLRHLESGEPLPLMVPAGNLYHVRIKAHGDHFLDWDKPLSEQSEHVRKALLEHPDPVIAGTAEKWGKISGGDLYRRLEQRLREQHDDFPAPDETDHTGPLVARKLSEAGIPGIKYLDQGSRPAAGSKPDIQFSHGKYQLFDEFGAHAGSFDTLEAAREAAAPGKPTHNLVLFDDKHVEITHKNGEAVSRGERQELLHEKRDNPAGADVLQGPRAARGPRARDPETWSLNEFLASRGGLDPADPMIGDVRHAIGASNKFVPGFGHLIRKNGMRLDQAREAAVEAGYLFDAGDHTGRESQTTINTLLEAVDLELRGERVYRAGREPEKAVNREAERHDLEREILGALGDDGIKSADVSDARMSRMVEMMQREGVRDPAEAWERALMEEAQRDEDNGQQTRPADAIPGWDVPPDAEAAPGDRAPAARAGSAEGEGARAPGGRDRAAGGGKPDWDKLEQLKRPDDADLAEVSRAADKTPEPESAADDPARVVSAAERAAAEADKLLEDILPGLTEEERTAFTDALDALAADKAQREQMLREGTQCLLAALA